MPEAVQAVDDVAAFMRTHLARARGAPAPRPAPLAATA
jgi:hypothetical protein